MERDVRIKLSIGLVTIAVMHAVLLALVFTALHFAPDSQHRDNRPLLDNLSANDTLYREPTISAPMTTPLNPIHPALEEVKHQAPCIPCTPALVPITPVRRPTPAPLFMPAPAANATQPAVAPAKYQIALFVDSSTRSQTLLNWWNTDPQLQSLRSKCDFQLYTPTNSLYRTRYASLVPTEQFPAVLFLRPDGGHIHAAGGNVLPGTASELWKDLQASYELSRSVQSAQTQVLHSADSGLLRERGYNWDAAIQQQTLLTQSPEDCLDGSCTPGDNGRLLPLFDRDTENQQAVLWANAQEIVTVGLFAIAGLLGCMLLGVVILRRT